MTLAMLIFLMRSCHVKFDVYFSLLRCSQILIGSHLFNIYECRYRSQFSHQIEHERGCISHVTFHAFLMVISNDKYNNYLPIYYTYFGNTA